MYEKFFGFRERPFQLVPNPAYLYLSRSHEEALAHLTYAVAQGDGFVEITGEVGTGKTTLCRVFLGNLKESVDAAYIFNPMMDGLQLLKSVNDEFGIPSDADNIKDLIDTLNSYLMDRKRDGKQVILLIDEAQNLSPDVLEQLRLLSNLETDTSKLIQIILVGQPELREKLDSHELRQLSQRITLSCHLTPLDYKESRAYILHRIHIAAQKTGVRFTRSAFKTIYRYSGGIPRLINISCDRAMLTAFSLNRLKITGNIAATAVQELASRSEIRKGRIRNDKKTLLALTAFTLLLIPISLFLPGRIYSTFLSFIPGIQKYQPGIGTQENPLPDGTEMQNQKRRSESQGSVALNKNTEEETSVLPAESDTIMQDGKKGTAVPPVPDEGNSASLPEKNPPVSPADEKNNELNERTDHPDFRHSDGLQGKESGEKEKDKTENRDRISEGKKGGQTEINTEKTSVDLENFLKTENQPADALPDALRATIRLWQPYAAVRKARSDESPADYFRSGAGQNSFSILLLDENASELIQKLNLPAILEFRLPTGRDFCYLTLVKFDGKNISLVSGEKQIQAEPDIFSRYWTGRAFILWKNYFGIIGTIPRESSEDSLISLKMALRDIGFAGLDHTADYDEKSREAVKMIQEKHGLKVDGSVGPHTKIVIYNELPNLNIPHIIEKK